MAPFNLNSLVALDALLRHATLTAAAREVNLSQPAMSSALKRLREIFGDELVHYERGRTIYTRIGDDLRPQVADILARSRDLVGLARRVDPTTIRATIAICAPQSTLSFLNSRLVAALASLAPGIEIRSLPFPLPPGYDEQVDIHILPGWKASPMTPVHPVLVESFSCLVVKGFETRHIDEEAFLSCSHAALPVGEDELLWPEESAARRLLARRHVGARAWRIDAIPFLVQHYGLMGIMTTRMAQMHAAMSTTLCIGAPAAFAPVALVAQAASHRARDPVIRWLLPEMTRIADMSAFPERAGFSLP